MVANFFLPILPINLYRVVGEEKWMKRKQQINNKAVVVTDGTRALRRWPIRPKSNF